MDLPPPPPRPSMRRELEAALAQLEQLHHHRALNPTRDHHPTTPKADISRCTIRISAEEASLLWAAGQIALLMRAADG